MDQQPWHREQMDSDWLGPADHPSVRLPSGDCKLNQPTVFFILSNPFECLDRNLYNPHSTYAYNCAYATNPGIQSRPRMKVRAGIEVSRLADIGCLRQNN